MPIHNRVRSLLALASVGLTMAGTLTSVIPAQDPVPPPQGFPVRLVPSVPITYSDGYQTLLDVRYPDLNVAPQTGWPCAVVMHGGAGHRRNSWVITTAEMLTKAGYVTLAYDAGGSGVTTGLNTPGDRAGVEKVRDLAEMYHFAEARLGTRMDFARLAIFGRSAGGSHALWAAAWSGKPLPIQSNIASTMPEIMAAHSDIQVLDFLADHVPGGNMIKSYWLVSVLEKLGPTDPVSQMLLNNDYAGLSNYILADPTLQVLPLLRQSDVPLFVNYAYDDRKHFVNVNMNAMAQLKASTPHRYYQGTGGHSSAENDIEETLRNEFTRRWFDRFLKGVQNGVDAEPFAEIAVIPNETSRHFDRTSHWKHRRTPTWPIAPTQSLYLRAGGELRPTPPAGLENGPTIEHRVQPGYDVVDYVQDKGLVTNVLPKIPLVTESFDTPPLPEPREIFGRTVVELDVVNTTADFQLQAALLDVPPTGAPQFITGGVTARRGGALIRKRLRIELGDVAYVVRSGHKLRLSIENISVRRQPGNANFYTTPEFTDCDIRVQIDAVFPPRVELPLRAARASLTPRIGRVHTTAGIAHDLHMHGESSRAGSDYLLLMGSSGNTPGFGLPPHVPLNVDVLTTIGLDLINTPLLQNFAGRLDANGYTRATVAVPPGLAGVLLGYRLDFAGVGLDSSNQVFVTNPVEVVIQP